ncbi:hypothetical protein BH10PSE7_BH10PSE7_42670 [soil metagenome]
MARRKTAKRSRNGGGSFQYGQLFTDALGMASTMLDSRKQSGAEKIDEIAAAARTFGESFSEFPYLSSYIDAASEAMDEASAYISQTSVQDMVEDLSAFARRQPAATLALTAVAGLAAVQLVRTEGPSFLSGGRKKSKPRRRSAAKA